MRRDLAIRVDHHVPGQISYFGSAQTRFHREQNDDAIAEWCAGSFGEEQEAFDLSIRKYLCLFARHVALIVAA
jgi:hypothetical protein